MLVGGAAGFVAGGAMAATVMSIGEISSEPTAVAGVESSTWTPVTAISSFMFGLDAFHGDFHLWSIAFGVAAHMALSVAFGIAGVAFIVVTQGPYPGAVGAALQGVAYALFLQIFFLNLVVGGIQDVHTVYESIPQWGWWVGHAAYGAMLGLAASVLLGRPEGG